ncbi:MAG: choice-of-anchor D domain-containing protein [Planctomycetes bacterium]|nr:choice-of-anchor D domain-containing protein [Planctomycetota bacterium]
MRGFWFLLLLWCAAPLAAQGLFTANPNLAIPDNNANGVSSTINVPATADAIYSLRVGVRITHTYDADLSIWLLPPGVSWTGPYCTPNNGATPVPPAGVIELSTKNGGNANNYGSGSGGGTVYSNFTSTIDPLSPSSVAITSGGAPFTSQAQWTPEGLTAWNQMFATNPTGTWTLIVADGWGQDTGTLDSWQLEYVQPPANQLTVSVGAANSPGPTLHPGFTNQVAGQLTFASTSSLTLTSVTIQAENGVLNNATNFSRVALHQDLNGNGQIDAGDTQVFTGALVGSSNITLTAAPAVSFAGAQTQHYLVVVDVAAAPAALGVAYRIVAATNVNSSGNEFGAFPLALGYHHFGPIHSWGSAPLGGLAVPNGSGTGVADTIAVPGTQDRIGSLRVGVRLDEDRDRDVDMYLIPPGVTWAGPYTGGAPAGVIELSTDNGGNGNDYGTGAANGPYVYTYFSGSSDPLHATTQAISGGGAGGAPFTSWANYRPEGLATWNALYDSDPSGNWTLAVADDNNGGIGGTLISWYIEYSALGRAALTGATNFGSSVVGVLSAGSPQAFSVTNPGELPLTISNINFAGANPGDFALSPALAFPIVVPGGGVQNFGVSFTPGAVGARSATLQVFSDHNGVPNTLTPLGLTGTGISTGEIDVQRPAASSIADGGNDALGTTLVGIAAPFTYTIQNVAGAGDINITAAITAASLANCNVAITQPGVTLLGPGTSTTFQVNVTALAPGAFSFALVIPNDDANENPYDIAVSGNAVTPPQLSATSPVNYGSSNLGVPTALVGHTISNSGGATLNVTSISIVGANAGDWALISAPATMTIAPGANQVLQGQFTPTAAGARTAQLRLVSDHGGVPGTITLLTLQGSGTIAAASVTTPVNYGSSNVGVATAPIGHTLTNSGSGPMTITALSVGGDWALTGVPALPATVNAGGNFNFSGIFTPSTTGARNATIQISWDQGGGVGATVANITVNGNGTQATASVTTPVNYGSSNVGVATAPVGHSLTNSGSGPLTITAISVGGDWALSGVPALPATVTAGGNFNFNGVFTPTASGARNATIQISWNQGGGIGPQVTNIVVNGNGTLATIGVTTPVNYGSSNVGIAAPAQNHLVNNTGTGPMTITAISITAGDWVLNNLPSLPANVPAGNNVNFDGVFTPTAVGARSATITITWNQGGGVGSTMTTINVNGTGTQAVLSVTTPVAYGSSNVGVSSAPINHLLDNTGGGPLQITSIALTGANPGDWALSALPTLPATVSAGGSENFDATFTPTTTGARTATVSITWNQGAGSTITQITLNGTGTQAGASVASPVNYGSSNVGVATAPVGHTLTNSGSGPMTITAVSVGGDWALSGVPGLPATVVAGGTFNFSGIFTPTAPGARSATIQINWNQGGGVSPTATSITVDGNGTQAAASVASPVNYGNSNVGVATAPVGHTLTNTGTGPMSITAVSVGGDWTLSGVPALPATVAAGGTFNFSGIFTPTATGARTATIQITWNQGGGASPTVTNITVDGNGTLASAGVTSPVNYGDSNVGVATAAVGHTLTNTGTGPMTITAASVGGDWTLSGVPALPVTIGAGGTFNFSGIFTPTAAGARTATIQVSWNQGGGVGPTITNITVDGNGTQATAGVTSPVNYGDSNVGVATAPTGHTLTNTGTGPMTITAASVGGDWSLTGVPGLPVTIAAGGTFNFSGIFTPTATGARTATIQISWNQGGGVSPTITNITVDGNGTLAAAGVTSPVNYGNSNVGVATTPIGHTLTNTGSGPMTITAVSVGGDWTLSGVPALPATVAAGGTFNFSAIFAPTATGARTATIQISWNQGSGVSPTVTNITVNGNGTIGSISVTTPVNYGSSNVGVPTAPFNHVVGNSGSGPIEITGIAATGDWAVANLPSLPATVASLANTNFDGIFTPTAAGARNGTLDITWNQGGGIGSTMTSIFVSGTGTAGAVTLSNNGNYGMVATGSSSSPVMHTITNTGSGSARILAVSTAGADAAFWSLSGTPPVSQTLAPAGFWNFSGQFSPTTVRAYSAQLVVDWDNGPSTTAQQTIIGLTGTGVAPSAVTNVQVGPDDGGPVRVQGDVSGPAASLVDVTVTYTGGAQGGTPGPATISMVVVGYSVVGNVIQAVPEGTTLVFYWDAYATEGHTTASDYVITLSPAVSGVPGTPGSSAMFTLTRQGSWTKYSAIAGSPGPVSEQAMIRDVTHDRLVVFGGFRNGVLSNDAWEFVYATSTWRLLTPSGTPPSPRREVLCVYDSANNQMIVFGGSSATGDTNDTFALDLTPGAESWTEIAISAPRPSIRTHGTLVLDAPNNRAILYGGFHSSTVLNDVWALDLTPGSENWGSGALTTTNNPVAQSIGNAAIYDPVGARMLVYRAYTSELWEMTLGGSPTWTNLMPSGGPVFARYAAVAYDSLRHAMILQGGLASTAAVTETWSLDIATLSWSQLPDEPNSGGRFWHSGAYDETRDQFVMLGGRNFSRVQNATLAVLSLATPATWLAAPDATSDAAGPAGRTGAVMVNDALNNRVLLFGGLSASGLMNDLWALDRSTPGPWIHLSQTGTIPSARSFAAACYDSANQRVILFGGQGGAGYLDDVWTLDVATLAWQQWTATPGPTGRALTSIACDAGGNRILLFGGQGTVKTNDYWEFDFAQPPATRWSQPATLGTSPVARCGHGSVYDSVNDRLVVFCGETPSERIDVWALDYTLPTPTWIDISPTGSVPQPRTRFAMGATPNGSTVYVHGGKLSYLQLGDTWRLDLTAPTAAWSLAAAYTGAPNERVEHTGCIDNAGLFVVGTGKYGLNPAADAWEIDFTAPTPAYSQLAVPNAPPNLSYAQSAYDPVGNRMIVFSGLVNGANYAALWQVDLSATPPAWSVLPASGTAPIGRTGASFVYDAAHSPPRILMYGGRVGSTLESTVDELWSLELTPGAEQWIKLSPSGSLGRRTYHSAILDGAGSMIVFGGTDIYGGPSASLLRLNLGTLVWSTISASGTGPSVRMYPHAIYDGQGGRNRMLVYGGFAYSAYKSDLFELNLTTMTWTQLASLPPASAWNSMVHDAAGERFVLYGGCGSAALGGLYTFDLTTDTWAQVAAPGSVPQARWGHSAVWDSAADRMVVVGGSGGTFIASYVSGIPLTEQAGTLADMWFWGD